MPPTPYVSIVSGTARSPKRLTAMMTLALKLLLAGISVITLTLHYTDIGLLPSSYHSARTSASLDIASISASNTYVKPQPREAYVTFLSANTNEDYFTSARMVLFSLKHDPTTSDPYNRDFVVIHPPGLPRPYVAQLEEEGAVVLERPLIDSLPVPSGGWKAEWSEVYTKLWLFNLTQYDRVVFYDADHLVLKPVHSLWNASGSNPESGIASLGSGDGGNVPGSSYFLAGFFLAVPSSQLMRELLEMRDYDPVFPEQNLMNAYFKQDGPHPWVELDQVLVLSSSPVSRDRTDTKSRHERISPQEHHLREGYHTVHEKCWLDWVPEGLKRLYWEKRGRMELFWSLHTAFGRRGTTVVKQDHD